MITDTPKLRIAYLTFEGTDTYVDAITGDALDDLAEFTVEALIYIDNFDAYKTVVEKGDVSGGAGWSLEIATNGEAFFYVETSGGTITSRTNPEALTEKTWAVVTAHYVHSTHTATVALDGTWGTPVAGSGTYPSEAGEQMTIGCGQAIDQILKGRMSWVALYSGDKRGAGVNFTSTHVPPLANEADLIDCWKFDHRSFTMAPLVSRLHAGEIHSDEYAWAHGDWETCWSDETPTGTNADLRDETGDVLLQVVAERYLPEFVEQANWAGEFDATNFDCIVCDDTISMVFAYDGDIETWILASEDEGDESWNGGPTLNPSPVVDTTVEITLATDNSSTVRVFYYDGTSIRYYESANKGSTWGSSTLVANLADVLFLAATSLTRVHVGVASNNNVRLYCYDYNAAAWNQVGMGVRLPVTPESMTAVSCPDVDITTSDGADILAFATDLPFVLGRRLQGLELAYTMEQVKGLVISRYQNGRWSEMWDFDYTDEPLSEAARTRCRLSTSGDWRFMTYQRVLGSFDYVDDGLLAILRSKDGIHWESPWMTVWGWTGDTKVLVRGIHVYMITPQGISRAPLCGFFGDPQDTMELTDYVLDLSQVNVDTNSLQVSLANPNIPGITPNQGDPSPYRGELEYRNPRDPAVASQESMLVDGYALQMRVHLGYWIDGEGLGVQTGIFDVDYLNMSRALRNAYMQISASGIVNRIATRQPDHVNEWESQIIGGDDFNTPDTTDFSGLRHTATMSGSFDTPNGQYYLRNISEDEESVAFSTFLSDAWHGCISIGIYCANKAGSYVGVVAHAYDNNNLIACVFDLDSNTIQVNERRNGSETNLYTSGAMGWSAETWYYLRVHFWHGLWLVYTSTDGVTFTSLTTLELAGMAASWDWNQGWTRWNANWANWVAGDIPFMGGRVGFIANGYTKDGTETRLKNAVINNSNPPQSVEDATRTLAIFAGVHDFSFRSLVDETFDDFDDWTGNESATWDVSTGKLVATGGGGVGPVYCAFHDDELPPAFVVHFDLVSGIGAFVFHGKEGAQDCLAVWWTTTACGVSYFAGTGNTLLLLPYGLAAVSGAGSSIVGRVTIKTSWQTDTKDDIKKWLLVSLFVDNLEYFSHAIEWAAGTYEWDGERIGFAVWDSNTMTVDNLYVQELHRECAYFSVDPGEAVASGIHRAIGSTSVRMSELADGSLSMHQGVEEHWTVTPDWSPTHNRVVGLDERRQLTRVPTHFRIIGATDILDYVRSTTNRGHFFEQVDDPNLITQEELYEEGQRRSYNAEEDLRPGSLTVKFQPLIQVWDIVFYNSRSWRVLGVRHQLGGGMQTTKLDVREAYWSQ